MARDGRHCGNGEREQLVKHGIQILVEKVRIRNRIEQVETVRENLVRELGGRDESCTAIYFVLLDAAVPFSPNVTQGRYDTFSEERVRQTVVWRLLATHRKHPDSAVS